MSKNLTPENLIVGMKIRSVHSGETAEIIASDGDISIEITSGSDLGECVDMSPAEVITYWRAEEL
jgi:hypothetical protein